MGHGARAEIQAREAGGTLVRDEVPPAFAGWFYRAVPHTPGLTPGATVLSPAFAGCIWSAPRPQRKRDARMRRLTVILSEAKNLFRARPHVSAVGAIEVSPGRSPGESSRERIRAPEARLER